MWVRCHVPRLFELYWIPLGENWEIKKSNSWHQTTLSPDFVGLQPFAAQKKKSAIHHQTAKLSNAKSLNKNISIRKYPSILKMTFPDRGWRPDPVDSSVVTDLSKPVGAVSECWDSSLRREHPREGGSWNVASVITLDQMFSFSSWNAG